jgi:hypothetical protein
MSFATLPVPSDVGSPACGQYQMRTRPLCNRAEWTATVPVSKGLDHLPTISGPGSEPPAREELGTVATASAVARTPAIARRTGRAR